MSDCIRQICMLSVLFGVLLEITPEGNVKKISSIVCSAALVTLILSGIKETDVSEYYSQAARLRETNAILTQNAADTVDRLSRLVIQEECEEYIKDKAVRMGVNHIDVKVTARWNSDGFWMPETVSVWGEISEEKRDRLGELMEMELGIQKGNQTWNE